MDKNIRKSNIELLRIVGILQIISFHYVYKGGFQFESFTLNKFIVKIFWMFGELGVNLFILITGYFMIHSSFQVKKCIKLILQVNFYMILSIGIACVLGIYDYDINIKQIINWLFPVIRNRYWFITAYILIYILSPYMNMFAKMLSQQVYIKFILLVLCIWCIVPTIFGVLTNDTESLLFYTRLLWLSIVYFIGAYIRLYSFRLIKSRRNSSLLSIISFGAIICSILVIEGFSKIFAVIGLYESAYFWQPNTIPMFLLSIGVFGIFLNMNIPNNKLINKLASTTLGIYLLHDGELSAWLWDELFCNASHQDSKFLVIYIIGTTIIIFMVGACIDLCRQLFERVLFDKIGGNKVVDFCCDKANEIGAGIIDWIKG